MKKEILKRFLDAVVNISWNTSRQKYTLIKTLTHLYAGDLMETLQEDRDRIKEDLYIKSFYDEMKEINKSLPFNENKESYILKLETAMFPSKLEYKDSLFSEIIQDNYLMLKEDGLLSLLSDFGCYFRGEIVAVHRIEYLKIIIIETKQKPFSNEKGYHHNEKDEAKFYSTKNPTTCFSSFEDVLFAELIPSYSNAVSALYEQQKKS